MNEAFKENISGDSSIIANTLLCWSDVCIKYAINPSMATDFTLLSLSPDTEKILCSDSFLVNPCDSLPNFKLPSC